MKYAIGKLIAIYFSQVLNCQNTREYCFDALDIEF